MSRHEDPAYLENLTHREVEVLRLIALGKSNREIASTLVLSQHTVGEYVGKILAKTGATNRAGLATYAAHQGLQSCFHDVFRLFGVKVAPGSAISHPSMAEPRAPAYPDGLTHREVEVLRLVALGKSNQEIAEELRISLYTAGHHVSNIIAKTEVNNRAGLAAYAALHGISHQPAAGWCGVRVK